MPNWSNTPPTEPNRNAFDLRRTPANGYVLAIVTSPDLIGCPTHYFQHRTIPCEAEDCAPCKLGVPSRWHGYVSALDTKTSDHFLFECTAMGAEAFTRYRADHGTLRGCHFHASRPAARANGRVLIRTKPADLAQVRLPEPPNVLAVLAQIWGIALSELGAGYHVRGHRTATHRRRKLDGPQAVADAVRELEGRNGQ
jgi:hypothetical protein